MTGKPPPPIVYTIAGSDSGGGAGIQADLHAIHSFGCHGCSAITTLTAQNSCGVSSIFAPPLSFLRNQLDCLTIDLPPRAIKIGMLGSADLAETVGTYLKEMKQKETSPQIVLDPVMISTSGHKLLDNDDAMHAMIQNIFPHTMVLTPNLHEAKALLYALGKDNTLQTRRQVEQGARDLLEMGVESVLIKGGHVFYNETDNNNSRRNNEGDYAQDYFLSKSTGGDDEEKPRLCDGHRGVWLQTRRFNSVHTHGTGCTLSSCIASSLALASQRLEQQEQQQSSFSLTKKDFMVDACCLAKAYVTQGIQRGVGLGQGPGPVVQTQFPYDSSCFPHIIVHRDDNEDIAFPQWKPSTKESLLLPIVDSIDWIQRLAPLDGINDLQLRIKNCDDDEKQILEMIRISQNICQQYGVRLWINDYWKQAIQVNGVFGVHLGQEDLYQLMIHNNSDDDTGDPDIDNDFIRLKRSGLAFGISTHSHAELAVALGIRPSYISLGPIFSTNSKQVDFLPQGLERIQQWNNLIPSNIPLIVIGGISNTERIQMVTNQAGKVGIAVIGAITQDERVVKALQENVDEANVRDVLQQVVNELIQAMK